MTSVVLATVFLTLALMRSGVPITWGTASTPIIPVTVTSFDAKGAILTAWLANLPQALLSLFYFSINRICTSICFAREWNSYATTRKGLRVTSPTGHQRSTHFLQLPLRWAMPLTIMSGVLHPESTCACGYSVLSLLAFTVVFCGMIAAIGVLLMRSIDVQLPPARHSSLVISAACHPPPEDIDCHLKPVRWGVVQEGTKNKAGHCTFTSLRVSKPEAGCLYA